MEKIQSFINDVRKFYGRSNSDTSDEFKCKNRSTTDVCFLLIFTIFLIVALCLIGYCVINGDIFRIVNGYDNCGNVCGRKALLKRDDIRGEECQATTTLSNPYQIILRRTENGSKIMERFCVSNCNDYEGYRKFLNRCIANKTGKLVNTFISKSGLQNFFEEVSDDFQMCWREFLYLCLISLAFSIVILILFRYLVGIVVWVVLIGVVVASIAGTITLWILWDRSRKRMVESAISDMDNRKTGTFLALSIAATIITLLVILVIFVMRKRIELVVALFKEAGKAVASMPLILFQPLLTFCSIIAVISLWFYFSLWIESSGYLSEKPSKIYYYQKDFWMKFTRWYNLFAGLWMLQFVIGCQHMVIAGAVSHWYFMSDKDKPGAPIWKSALNLIRYHLGSVALGSFIIALVQFVRILLKIIEKYLRTHEGKCVDCALKGCQCCLYCFEKILKYLSRNAYIEVAMYGYNFCQGGRQAFKLLVSNVLRVTAINSVGDFVLFLGKVIVVVATVLIGVKMLQNKEGVQHIWVPVTLAGLFAYFIAHCFMTVYEMAIDTIFLCFCEDCEQNDGVNRPYYMSRGLMEFVENSRRSLDALKARKSNWRSDDNVKVPNISETVDQK